MNLTETMKILPFLRKKILPFGTKTEMVEILPKQNVINGETYEGFNWCTFAENLELQDGKEYQLVINGIEYKAKAVFDYEDESMMFQGTGDYSVAGWGTGGENNDWEYGIQWPAELGETITLAIYEEKEVVQPMNAKFGGIIVIRENDTYSCNTTYAELRKMAENDALSIVNVKYVEKQATIIKSL